MSEDIRVNITRAGVANPIATNIVCQLDKMPAVEAATYQDSDPHFTYSVFTTMLPLNNPQLILFRDYMVDQVVTDAVTGSPRKYLIIDEPDMHMIDGHWQWTASRMRGT
jgi:hypothetical protein